MSDGTKKINIKNYKQHIDKTDKTDKTDKPSDTDNEFIIIDNYVDKNYNENSNIFIVLSKDVELDNYIYEESIKNNIPKLLKMSSKTNKYITRRMIDVVHIFLLNVENLVLHTSSQTTIEAYAMRMYNKNLQDLSLKELDTIADSYISYNNIYAICDGFLGIGGILFSAVEVPLLLCITCRLLTQLSWIYGIKCDKENSVVVLRLLVGSVDYDKILEKDGKKNKDVEQLKTYYEDHKLAICEYNMLHDSLSMSTVNNIVKLLAYCLGTYFSTSELVRLIPVVGFFGGLGANYYYINTTAKHALKILRKDWILRKYGREKLNEHKQKNFVI